MKANNGPILFMILLSAVILLPWQWGHVSGQSSLLLTIDLEDDDGGLKHGGTGDLWKWGEPGSGSRDNPGPDGAGEGKKVWGCPLNGTYANGMKAYLSLPLIDTSRLKDLTFSYLYWMDLTLMIDEMNETGGVLGSDHCSVQISVDGKDWIEVNGYNGTRTADWTVGTIQLSEELGDSLIVRFLLIDDPDGYTDNGFFIDDIEISGEERPEVSLSLGPDTYIPPVVARDEVARITYQVLDNGLNVPENTYVTVYIESVSGTQEFFHMSVITAGSADVRVVEWLPSSSGSFRGWINLTVGGEQQEGRSFNTRSFSPIYYDDSSSGTSHLTIEDGVAEAEWTTINPPVEGFSMSGGRAFWYGSPSGGPESSAGFQGPTWAYMETDWIDLTYYTDSFLYMYHRYSFLGPRGSSGGVVEALNDRGSWEVIEPLGFSYGKLKENISGPLAGADAIVGSEDWGVDGFQLAPFTGGSTRLRLSVVADELGFGEGWFIDDIMVVGEGYDPFDTEPPAAIEGLTVEVVDEGAVTLYWDPSSARDFGHYSVYIERFEFQDILGLDPFVELDSEDQDSLVITDLDPLIVYWVGVTAVDIVGNEDNVVQAQSFKASVIDSNRAPIADIKIQGGSYTRTIGEDIVFDAGGSRDPDGDPLTYFWTMPDGSTFRGSSVTWQADRSGEDLEIVLIVKDSHGLSDTDSITLDIESGRTDIYNRGDLWPFLLLVIPLVLVILFIVLIAVIFRSSTRKRLEKRLEKIGMDPEGFLLSRNKDRNNMKRSNIMEKHNTPKVHDLVPISSVKEEEKEDVELIPEWKEPGKTETGKRPRPREVEFSPSVKVVIECPFCSELFKEKVEVRSLKEHHVITVKCPHCNRSGDITP